MGSRDELLVWTDGGSRGNPGQAAIGVVIKDGKKELFKFHGCVGIATNNMAEYSAVLKALEFVKKDFKQCDRIYFKLDSELVVKQLNGQYKVKDINLKKKYFEIRKLVVSIGGHVAFTHVTRENNREADKLVNIALDTCQK